MENFICNQYGEQLAIINYGCTEYCNFIIRPAVVDSYSSGCLFFKWLFSADVLWLLVLLPPRDIIVLHMHLHWAFVSFTNRKVFPRKTAFLHVNVQLVTRRLNYYAADRYCSAGAGELLVLSLIHISEPTRPY